MKQFLLRLILSAAAVVCLASVAAACPNCRGAVAESGETMAAGFAWSIGVMLLAPATILTIWAFVIRKVLRQLPERF